MGREAMKAAVAAIALLALVGGVAYGLAEDADAELVLPVDNKHFLDYVVALVDEFAPGEDYSEAMEDKKEMAEVEERDQKEVTETQTDLDKAKQALNDQKKIAEETGAALKASMKKESFEQQKVAEDKKKTDADAKQERADKKKLAADKEAVRKDDKLAAHDGNKLRKEQDKLRKDKKVTQDDKKKHEKQES